MYVSIILISSLWASLILATRIDNNQYLPPYTSSQQKSNTISAINTKYSPTTSGVSYAQIVQHHGATPSRNIHSSFGGVQTQKSGFGDISDTQHHEQSKLRNIQGYSGTHQYETTESNLYDNANAYQDYNRNTINYNKYSSGEQQFGSGRYQTQNKATILKLENRNIGDGSYQYSYETSDGSRAEEHGEATAGGTRAVGSFSYTSPEGKQIGLSYIADENGYQPQGDHIPTPHPIPEAIQKSIEFNRQTTHYNKNYENKGYTAYNEDINKDIGRQHYNSGYAGVVEQKYQHGSGRSDVYTQQKDLLRTVTKQHDVSGHESAFNSARFTSSNGKQGYHGTDGGYIY